MAISVTCQAVRSADGKFYIRWSDKMEQEFESRAAAIDFVRQFAGVAGKDFLRAMALAKYLNSDPNGTNPNLLIGKTITLDLDVAANIVRVT